MCSCRGDSRQCCNDQTKADQEREDDDDNTTNFDEQEQYQWTELDIHMDTICEIEF